MSSLFGPGGVGAAANLTVQAAKTGSYTLLITDGFVTWDLNAGAGTATLPTAVGNSGVVLRIGVITTGNLLTINTTSSQTVGPHASGTIKFARESDCLSVVSDGSNWRILSLNVDIRAYAYISADRTPGTSQVNYNAVGSDVHGMITTGASWKLTVPMAGTYSVKLTSSASTGGGGTLTLYGNGSAFYGLTSLASAYANTVVSGSIDIQLAAGGFIDVRPDTTGSTLTATMTNSVPRNIIYIVRTGD